MLINLKQEDLGKSIYRIISLERLLELFHTKKSALVNPDKWDDTFENFILKSKRRKLSGEIADGAFGDTVYGQCWTLHSSSDAMWRIYSPNKNSLRIKTTIGALFNSLCKSHPYGQSYCCVGRVEYKSINKLNEFADTIFDDSGISLENIFKSVLVKRKDFKHENEIRLLCHDLDERPEIYFYDIDPYELIQEITIDPRKSEDEYKIMKLIIEKSTGYTGEINRSNLYSLPMNRVLKVTQSQW